MTALGYTSTTETILGWRVWRVLPFQLLDGTQTYRLCAVGTLGRPKLWEPQQRLSATCSIYETGHESPWPDCECGIWALRSPEDARCRLIAWTQTQGGEPAGWAIGRVSLWGRVVEHEEGWRAQFAYPYSISIESDSEEVVRAIRSEYAVDVEWAGAELFETVTAKRRQKVTDVANGLQTTKQDIRDLRSALDRLKRTLGGSTGAILAPEPLKLDPEPDGDELLVACVAAIAGEEANSRCRLPLGCGPLLRSDEVCEALLLRRDEAVDAKRVTIGEDGWREALGATKLCLSRLQASGYIESGTRPRWNLGDWRLTAAGLEKLRTLEIPEHLPVVVWRGGQVRVEVETAPALRALERAPCLFAEEIEAQREAWFAERQTAKAQGRRAYRAWLVSRREEDSQTCWSRLSYSDEEVVTALREATLTKRSRFADFGAIADRLAPGKRCKTEAARICASLARLERQRKVEKKEKRWALADASQKGGGDRE